MVIAEEWEGYAVAALLARRGKRVSLLTLKQESPPLAAPFSFAEGPALYFGFEKGGLADTLFSELAFSMPLLRQDGVYNWISPPFQIILPSHRIDFSSDREELLDEFKRELGPHYGAIGELLADLDEKEANLYPGSGKISSLEPTGIRDRLVLLKEQWSNQRLIRTCQTEKALALVRRHLNDPKWESFLGLLSLFAFKKQVTDMTVFDLLILHGGIKRGVVRLVEGEKRLGKQLTSLIQSLRGEVISVEGSVKVKRADKGEGEVTLEGGRTFRAAEIIAALPETAIDASGPELGRLLIGFEVDTEVIPDPMREDVILSWENGDAPIRHNLLALKLTLPDEEKSLKKGVRALVASAYLTPEEFSADRLPGIEREIENRVRWLLPFSGERLRRSAAVRVPPPGRLRAMIDPSIYRSLRPVRVGAASYYRASKLRPFTYIPTGGAGAVDRLAFVMAVLHFINANSQKR